eukprot:7851234-Lingulodinium_polyedra.AAC.1
MCVPAGGSEGQCRRSDSEELGSFSSGGGRAAPSPLRNCIKTRTLPFDSMCERFPSGHGQPRSE